MYWHDHKTVFSKNSTNSNDSVRIQHIGCKQELSASFETKPIYVTKGHETNDRGQESRQWIGRRRLCLERQRHHPQDHRWSPGGAEADSPGLRPGNPPPVNTALKGRDGTALPHAISVIGQVPPRRGGILGGGSPQGASPGLSSCAPPGLHTDLIRAQPHPDNSCFHPLSPCHRATVLSSLHPLRLCVPPSPRTNPSSSTATPATWWRSTDCL